jgi:nucleotide-binding universal stress UspA family protein
MKHQFGFFDESNRLEKMIFRGSLHLTKVVMPATKGYTDNAGSQVLRSGPAPKKSGAMPPPATLSKEVAMRNFKTILCALDLSRHSEVVAEHAVALAKAFSAKVVAVYIAPALTQYVGFHVPPSSIENFVSEIVTGAEQNMREFVEANFKDIEAEGKVVNGYAAEEILNQAEACDADLIVMGTHGRVGIDRILFGSVAERIVKSSTIPVMTVRPQA